MRDSIRLLTYVLLVAVVAGCAETDRRAPQPIGKLSGVVLVDNEPLVAGRVLLERIDRTVAVMVGTDAKGAFVAKAYQSEGLPVGRYRVAASSLPPNFFGPPSPLQNPNDKVPLRYRSVHTSPLTVEVIEGPNPPCRLEIER